MKKVDKASYKNYFKRNYGCHYIQNDISNYCKWFWRQWRYINGKVQFKEKSNILEIGSGFGGFYNLFNSSLKEYNYIGLELDKTACNFANSYFRVACFKNTSIEEFKIKTKFDYIFAFEVLEHLSDPISSLKKIHSLLNKGGYFIGTSPYPYKKNILADETHIFVLHPINWQVLFKNAGYKLFNSYPMSFVPYIWRLNKHINIRLPFYIPIKYFISTSLIIVQK